MKKTFEIEGTKLIKYFGKDATVFVPKGVTEIGDGAFSNNCHIENVILPISVERIGDFAFEGCRFLEDIEFFDGVKMIGAFAFNNCYLLKICVLPNSIKEIGTDVFSNCQCLKHLIIPEGVEQIGVATFDNCISLKKLIIPLSLKRIRVYEESAGNYIFRNCNQLNVFYRGSREEFEKIKVVCDTEISDLSPYDYFPCKINFNYNFEEDEPNFSEETPLYIYKDENNCSLNHSCIDVKITLHNESSEKINVLAAYCEDCERFFITESQYSELKDKHGHLVDNFRQYNKSIPRKIQNKNYSGKLKDNGYSVSIKQDLSTDERRKILVDIIEKNILSKEEVVRTLSFFLTFSGGHKRKQIAVAKWKSDLEYIKRLKI